MPSLARCRVMARAPKVFTWSDGFHRYTVAATSRAKALCILVGNPSLFEPECRTPDQMRMANAFCAYLERAVFIGGRGEFGHA